MGKRLYFLLIVFTWVSGCIFLIPRADGNDSLWEPQSLANGSGTCSTASSSLCGLYSPYSPVVFNGQEHASQGYAQGHGWHCLPNGLIYPSYLAGPKEPRISSTWTNDKNLGWLWDFTLGGRVGLLRYGSRESILPTGFQLDLEGAVVGRMNLAHERDMMADDFRFGFPLTYGTKFWQAKVGYYHVSSHMGDEYMLNGFVNLADRLNYFRESIVFGLAVRPHCDVRLYGEMGIAVMTDGGAKPLEFQFGFEYSPISRGNPNAPSTTLLRNSGWQGAPFLAMNVYLRQENNFGGNVSFQTGWQWRGASNHLFRVGLYYLNGNSEQYQFFARSENKFGIGLWYDF